MTNIKYLANAGWDCVGSGSETGCTSATPTSYFYSQSNAPLDSWDFDVNWLAGASYPTLR